MPSGSEQTRTRLLEAAREVFAAHGFQGATVREICRRAEANVAAVNYHFGSKDELLAEALNFNALKALQAAHPGATPEVRLRLFIRDFMSCCWTKKAPPGNAASWRANSPIRPRCWIRS